MRIQTRPIKFGANAPLLIVLAALVACGCAVWATRAGAQSDLKVSAGFAGGEFVRPDARIELQLSRPLDPAEGALAVFVGDTDVTRLFTASGLTLAYAPKLVPLPAGETRLSVYLVSPANEWREIAQFPLRVGEAAAGGEAPPANGAGVPGGGEPAADSAPASAHGDAAARPAPNGNTHPRFFQTAEFKPSLTVNIRAQSAVLYYPETSRPDRINFTDVSIQGSLQTNHARGPFGMQSQLDFVGTSNQREALRFGERGLLAPQFDLSSYTSQFQIGKAKVTLGHSSYGANRYLVNGFSSRGLNVTVPLGARADFSFSAMNGTSVVGWNNFTGLQQRKHKVVSGTLGYEFLPKRPGGLRLEVGALRGSLLPVSNFNQGNLTDTERSNGFGLRVLASDSKGRLKIDAGFGRSRFGNPADPLLNQGFAVVPVQEEAKGARYLDLTLQILNNYALAKDRPINLSFTFRHNRVDPLFRSVALYAQADRHDNQFELTGSVGEITFGAAHNRANDNLDDILSVLKTLTRRNAFQVGGPLTALLGAKQAYSGWLPRLSYSYDLTHNYGAFLPVNAGFSLSHVPDQASVSQSLNADWSHPKWRFSYRLNESFQDNRQPGRERADLRNLVHSFVVGLTPSQRFNISLDLSSERAQNLELAQVDKNFRAGVQLNFNTTKNSAFAATISSAFGGDAASLRRSRNADLDLQWSTRFNLYEKERWRKVQAQFFVRYANRYASARDQIFFFNNLTKVQTMSAGLSFTFF
jgi:hypothetical protein